MQPLFARMMRDIALDVSSLTKNSRMEKRRLIWSTYNNIQTWFTLFKKELIDLGFACAATVDDGNDVDELIFFPGQLD